MTRSGTTSSTRIRRSTTASTRSSRCDAKLFAMTDAFVTFWSGRARGRCRRWPRAAGGGEAAGPRRRRRRSQRPRPPAPRRGAADRVARPDRRGVEAVRDHGEDRQHRRPANQVRRRPGRRRLRGGRRGGYHAPRRDLQLARARPRRSRALGAQDRSEPRVADRRDLRLLGRRAVRDHVDQHGAGRAARRDAVRVDDVPRPLRGRARRTTSTHTSTSCTASAARRFRRLRCSRTEPRTRRSPGCPWRRSGRLPGRVRVPGSRFAVTWSWDAASGTWKRSIFGAPETSRQGVQLAPKNVVVMFVPYVGGESATPRAPKPRSAARAGRWCSPRGKEITGTWSRPDKEQARTAARRRGERDPR